MMHIGLRCAAEGVAGEAAAAAEHGGIDRAVQHYQKHALPWHTAQLGPGFEPYATSAAQHAPRSRRGGPSHSTEPMGTVDKFTIRCFGARKPWNLLFELVTDTIFIIAKSVN